jgi:hypothetical protein
LSHAYLLWSVGTIIAAVRASHMLEMNIGTWKRRVSAEYVKSDVEDARQMGLVTVTLAEEYDDDQE